MDDIYVLDKDLNQIGIIDTYKSCIWSNRYKEVGDCELYIEATTEKLELLKIGNYLNRIDDDMICQIKKIEIDTDSEDGNYLIVVGRDVKEILDQRIIWNTMICDGLVEDFIRNMIDKSLINSDIPERNLIKSDGNNLLVLGEKAGFGEVTTEQVSYKNIGEKVREYSTTYNWGYKVILDNSQFVFKLYKGNDKSNYVTFSDDYENLSNTKYIEDNTNLGNISLTAGEGEGTERLRSVSGKASGINRYEIYVDAKDLSKTINYSELIMSYPLKKDGGQGSIKKIDNKYHYYMDYINIKIIDKVQLDKLKADYSTGSEIEINNILYYKINDVVIADLETGEPKENDNVVLRELVYDIYLLNRGYEKLSEYGKVVSFEGTVEPNITFEYKKDYFLGDLANVENEYGISEVVRIVEVIEVSDDKGYSIQPKFEYLNIN